MMSQSRTDSESRREAAVQLLLDHFRKSGPRWPGGDSITIDEVLDSYSEAAAEGMVPSREQLQARYPELAKELEELLGE